MADNMRSEMRDEMKDEMRSGMRYRQERSSRSQQGDLTTGMLALAGIGKRRSRPRLRRDSAAGAAKQKNCPTPMAVEALEALVREKELERQQLLTRNRLQAEEIKRQAAEINRQAKEIRGLQAAVGLEQEQRQQQQ